MTAPPRIFGLTTAIPRRAVPCSGAWPPSQGLAPAVEHIARHPFAWCPASSQSMRLPIPLPGSVVSHRRHPGASEARRRARFCRWCSRPLHSSCYLRWSPTRLAGRRSRSYVQGCRPSSFRAFRNRRRLANRRELPGRRVEGSVTPRRFARWGRTCRAGLQACLLRQCTFRSEPCCVNCERKTRLWL